ncbi:MAG: YqgE/AlgH family protein [Desulfamplus sp.]|nr:YqgE/AlgH family protein [Desulfamplus sp.]
MSSETDKFLKGHFLMAMPGLPDPNFAQTVICMCEHNELGALGFIINKTHPLLTGSELFDDLKIDYDERIAGIEIHFGGPVQPSGVFVLHSPPFHWHGCMQVTPNLGLSNTRDIIEAIAEGKGPENFIILLGCAGWGAFQLENEIDENAWLTAPVVEDIIFKTPTDLRWEEAMMLMESESDPFSDISEVL